MCKDCGQDNCFGKCGTQDTTKECTHCKGEGFVFKCPGCNKYIDMYNFPSTFCKITEKEYTRAECKELCNYCQGTGEIIIRKE